MSKEEVEIARRNASIRVLEFLDTARVVGLGTGSTVETFLRTAIDKLADKVLVASSIDTVITARSLGLAVTDSISVDRLDIYIDSADEVDPLGRMVKGGGGAMTMEKILASAATLRVFIIDELKLVPRVPYMKPIPVEVVPRALSIVKKKLEDMGFTCQLRIPQGKRAPVISDLGGAIIDVSPPRGWEPETISQTLDSIPGIVEHGLFIGYTDVLVIGKLDGKVEVVIYRNIRARP